MDTQFFTPAEVAKLLKISRALSYRLIAEGQIACIRFGRTVRISQAGLEEFIARHSGEAAPSQAPADPRPNGSYKMVEGNQPAMASTADSSPGVSSAQGETAETGPPIKGGIGTE